MSIPTQFEPLGNILIPYIQPVMTSNSDWSNKDECSFGCQVSASDSHPFIPAYPWWCLDDKHPSSKTYEDKTHWSWSYGKNHWWKARFEKEILFKGIEFWYNWRDVVPSQGDEGGIVQIFLDDVMIFDAIAKGQYYEKGEVFFKKPIWASLVTLKALSNKSSYGGFDIEKIHGFYRG